MCVNLPFSRNFSRQCAHVYNVHTCPLAKYFPSGSLANPGGPGDPAKSTRGVLPRGDFGYIIVDGTKKTKKPSTFCYRTPHYHATPLRRRVCWCVMLACHYERHSSDLSAVRVSEIARPPPPSPSQLLVRVRAAALNPADWKTAQGEQALLLSFAWPRVFGFDFAGTVAAVGGSSDDSAPFRVGDRVFGMIRGLPERDRGSLAEYLLVDAAVCARSPEGARDVDLASLPLVCSTAVRMLRACRLESFWTRDLLQLILRWRITPRPLADPAFSSRAAPEASALLQSSSQRASAAQALSQLQRRQARKLICAHRLALIKL